MAVYVDDMNLQADVPDGAKVVRRRWSHLFADTEDELRAFAQKIGLKQGWIQHPGQSHVHFDVTGRMRQRAIAAGATAVSWRQAGEFFAARARQALIPAGHGGQVAGRHRADRPLQRISGPEGHSTAALVLLAISCRGYPGWVGRNPFKRL